MFLALIDDTAGKRVPCGPEPVTPRAVAQLREADAFVASEHFERPGIVADRAPERSGGRRELSGCIHTSYIGRDSREVQHAMRYCHSLQFPLRGRGT